MLAHYSQAPHFSVVIPVYGCAACLAELLRRLTAALAALQRAYEIILVNDASPDGAWAEIAEFAARDPAIRGINLSRNFGQHQAIAAGLDAARGEWVVVMDCDLQDAPEEIARLHAKAQEGFDMVVGLRHERQDAPGKKFFSRAFSRVLTFLVQAPVDHRLGNFGIYSRAVIRAICAMPEHGRSFGLLALWVGFRRAEIAVQHGARHAGRSSYTPLRLLRLALDSIIAHSNRLLYFFVALGSALAALALLAAFWLLLRKLLWAEPLVGWTSLMVSLYFVAGLIVGCIGVIGLYIGKIFDQVKGRPLYIIAATTFAQERADA